MPVTPKSILEAVKSQIPVLVHGTADHESHVLELLTRQAIQEYQDRSGFSRSLVITGKLHKEGGVPLPEDWLELMSAHDSKSIYVSTNIYNNDIDGVITKFINVTNNEYKIQPFEVMYWSDLSDIDFLSGVLPNESKGIIQKYLHILISIPNNVRLSQVYSGMDHPAAEHIVSEETLMERKVALEEEMDEMMDFIPPVMIL